LVKARKRVIVKEISPHKSLKERRVRKDNISIKMVKNNKKNNTSLSKMLLKKLKLKKQKRSLISSSLVPRDLPRLMNNCLRTTLEKELA
jgi:hypothetical protein